MTTSPTMRCGNILIVFEGAGRIGWRHSTPTNWRPTGLWPNSTEAAAIHDQLSRGERVFVLMERGTPTVEMLTEEFVGSPTAIRALAIGDALEPISLRIPLLDWLPDELRRRGLAFIRSANERAEHLPHALLPPMLLDQIDEDVPQLRFGLLVRPCSSAAVAAAARHAFPSPPAGQLGDNQKFIPWRFRHAV